MNKFILVTSAAILYLGSISELWAVTCDFSVPNKVIITGSGGETFSGCPINSGGSVYSVENIEFGEGITTIGAGAIWGGGTWKTLSMPYIETVGEGNFRYSGLESVYMPNVTSVGEHAFFEATSLTSVTMPSVTSIGDDAFLETPLNDVNCLGTTQECENLKNLMQSKGATFDDSQFHVVTASIDDEFDDVSEDCPEGKIAKGDSCIDASQGCGENYRLSDGICYRIRYTPAEAAEVAGETNTIFLYYK